MRSLISVQSSAGFESLQLDLRGSTAGKTQGVLRFGFSFFAAIVSLGCQPQAGGPNAIERDPSVPSIIDGTAVQDGEAILGSIVSIKMTKGSCTGTLIREDVVLTAAHCPDMGGAQGLRVTLARADKPACGTAFVQEISYRPDAVMVAGSHEPDIALIRLQRPLCGGKPASVERRALKIGDVVRAAGYGRGTRSSVVPDRIDVRVVGTEPAAVDKLFDDLDPSKPEGAFRERARRLRDRVVGNYEITVPVVDGQALCHGDSGGPVYIEENGQVRVVGVNGAIAPHPFKGAATCNFAYLLMITPVALSLEWIDDTLAKWSKR